MLDVSDIDFKSVNDTTSLANVIRKALGYMGVRNVFVFNERTVSGTYSLLVRIEINHPKTDERRAVELNFSEDASPRDIVYQMHKEARERLEVWSA